MQPSIRAPWDKPTETAIAKAEAVDKPVVAPTTTAALSWLGAGYLIALVAIGVIAELLAYVTDWPEWVTTVGLIPALTAILRILERVIRYQLQLRGEG
jgi:hypothetical protein